MVSEFLPAGQLIFDLHLAHRRVPTARSATHSTPDPETQPAARCGRTGERLNELYTSRNGATDVTSWRVLAGTLPNTLATVGTYPSTGFETAIAAPTAAPYLRVQALAAAGTLLRCSAVVKS